MTDESTTSESPASEGLDRPTAESPNSSETSKVWAELLTGLTSLGSELKTRFEGRTAGSGDDLVEVFSKLEGVVSSSIDSIKELLSDEQVQQGASEVGAQFVDALSVSLDSLTSKLDRQVAAIKSALESAANNMKSSPDSDVGSGS